MMFAGGPGNRTEHDVHTCHAECPCQTGGEPTPDFLAVEGSLLPRLWIMAQLREAREADE